MVERLPRGSRGGLHVGYAPDRRPLAGGQRPLGGVSKPTDSDSVGRCMRVTRSTRWSRLGARRSTTSSGCCSCASIGRRGPSDASCARRIRRICTGACTLFMRHACRMRRLHYTAPPIYATFLIRHLPYMAGTSTLATPRVWSSRRSPTGATTDEISAASRLHLGRISRAVGSASQVLHDADDRAPSAPRRAAAGSGGHGQDGDGEGSREEHGEAVHRLQLLRWARLQVARPHVLRPRADGCRDISPRDMSPRYISSGRIGRG